MHSSETYYSGVCTPIHGWATALSIPSRQVNLYLQKRVQKRKLSFLRKKKLWFGGELIFIKRVKIRILSLFASSLCFSSWGTPVESPQLLARLGTPFYWIPHKNRPSSNLLMHLASKHLLDAYYMWDTRLTYTGYRAWLKELGDHNPEHFF